MCVLRKMAETDALKVLERFTRRRSLPLVAFTSDGVDDKERLQQLHREYVQAQVTFALALQKAQDEKEYVPSHPLFYEDHGVHPDKIDEWKQEEYEAAKDDAEKNLYINLWNIQSELKMLHNSVRYSKVDDAFHIDYLLDIWDQK